MPCLFAEFLSFEKILPLAIFGLFAVVGVVVVGTFRRTAHARRRAAGRIQQSRPSAAMRRGKRTRCRACSKRPRRRLPSRYNPRTNTKSASSSSSSTIAGFRSEAAPSIFLGMKFVGLVVGTFRLRRPDADFERRHTKDIDVRRFDRGRTCSIFRTSSSGGSRGAARARSFSPCRMRSTYWWFASKPASASTRRCAK